MGSTGLWGLRVSSLRSTGGPCDASDRHFCLESCQMAAKFNSAKADWLQLMANVRGGGGVCFESESHYYWPQPGLAWPGLVWVLYLAWSGIACQSFGVVRQPNMQTRTGNNVAATRHAANVARHTPQCGHTGTGTRARWGPCHLTHLPRWPFVVCALHNKATRTATQQQ